MMSSVCSQEERNVKGTLTKEELSVQLPPTDHRLGLRNVQPECNDSSLVVFEFKPSLYQRSQAMYDTKIQGVFFFTGLKV